MLETTIECWKDFFVHRNENDDFQRRHFAISTLSIENIFQNGHCSRCYNTFFGGNLESRDFL